MSGMAKASVNAAKMKLSNHIGLYLEQKHIIAEQAGDIVSFGMEHMLITLNSYHAGHICLYDMGCIGWGNVVTGAGKSEKQQV